MNVFLHWSTTRLFEVMLLKSDTSLAWFTC